MDRQEQSRKAIGFLDLARRRQSDRGYCDRPVEREKIDRCLEAARLAPSACNGQPWFLVVVDEPKLRAAFAGQVKDLVMNHFVTTAPVLVAVVTETPPLVPRLGGHFKNIPYYFMDIGIAVEHFCLQAVDEGLGTCIMGWISERGVKKVLQIPRSKRVPLVVSLGYPKDQALRPKIRKEAGELWGFNKYGR